ncbi:MAG: protein phosphatase CheZ [Gammaproteobacteria bacterium]|nr:protein phosphatase CheZ [Gammaproteobacteria bacterium]
MNQALSDHDTLLPLARRLVASIEADDAGETEHALAELTRLGESTLYQRLGELTRELHDALDSLRVGEDLSAISAETMPEAKERLDYVNTLTERAATDTLDAMDVSVPMAEMLGERARLLAREWDREPPGQPLNGMAGELREFLGDAAMASDLLRVKFSEVQMAQGFQDLTGQIIRRVTDIVQEVEQRLVELVVTVGQGDGRPRQGVPPAAADAIAAEGPVIPSMARGDVVSGQDDVDDLLAELGF